jgi:hypothetical protein
MDVLECVPFKSAPPQSYLPLVSHCPVAKLPHSRSALHTAVDIANAWKVFSFFLADVAALL